MTVSRETLSQKLTDYLQHQISLSELVDWAEEVMREGDFEEADYETLRDIVARLGVADVRAFGLTWEDCEEMLKDLGYQVRVEVVAQE